MKRLWIALFLLCAVCALSLGNIRCLSSLTEEVSSLLTQAQAFCLDGDWAKAAQLTEQASSLWQSHELYLHSILHHSDADEVFLGFKTVQGFLVSRQIGEYLSANETLMGRVLLIAEQDGFRLKNLF